MKAEDLEKRWQPKSQEASQAIAQWRQNPRHTQRDKSKPSAI
jgi:hypothetical protein